MLRRQPSPRRTPDRRGFSMIELLIVIVIIAILMSMLMVGIQSARATARVVQVTAEIKNLEKAIADFKMKFGVEPPSFIVLHETGTGWNTANAETRASRAIIRELWPSFNFAGNYDIDGDGNTTDVHVLNGAECLAFFLGGLQQPTDMNGDGTNDSVVARGFSANPAEPFLGFTGNRIGPFLENMDPARFVDVDNDGIWEYRDPIPGQTMPYQYFSSYGGRGYRLRGLDNTIGTADDEAVRIGGTTTTLESVYIQSLSTSATSPLVPYNEKGYQIISPGFDGSYGKGGYVNPESGVKSAPTDPASRPLQEERDNITNFKNGQLG